MVTPPISLRLRHREVTDRARETLRRLDQDVILRRRVRLLASKAHLLVAKMDSVAAPRLKLLASTDSGRWEAEIKLVQAILLKIAKGP
jgi:hypothetical protein